MAPSRACSTSMLCGAARNCAAASTSLRAVDSTAIAVRQSLLNDFYKPTGHTRLGVYADDDRRGPYLTTTSAALGYANRIFPGLSPTGDSCPLFPNVGLTMAERQRAAAIHRPAALR